MHFFFFENTKIFYTYRLWTQVIKSTLASKRRFGLRSNLVCILQVTVAYRVLILASVGFMILAAVA